MSTQQQEILFYPQEGVMPEYNSSQAQVEQMINEGSPVVGESPESSSNQVDGRELDRMADDGGRVLD